MDAIKILEKIKSEIIDDAIYGYFESAMTFATAQAERINKEIEKLYAELRGEEND